MSTRTQGRSGAKTPRAGAAVHHVEHLVDPVGGEVAVERRDPPGGQLGVEAVDQRLVRLATVGEADVLLRTRSRRPRPGRPRSSARRPARRGPSKTASSSACVGALGLLDLVGAGRPVVDHPWSRSAAPRRGARAGRRRPSRGTRDPARRVAVGQHLAEPLRTRRGCGRGTSGRQRLMPGEPSGRGRHAHPGRPGRIPDPMHMNMQESV